MKYMGSLQYNPEILDAEALPVSNNVIGQPIDAASPQAFLAGARVKMPADLL